MVLILTMAGRYQRFVDKGYKTPKYLLPWADRTVLWATLAELKKGDAFSNIVLIANQRDDSFMPHVRAIMASHGIDPANLFLIGDTSGQAETAAIGIEKARVDRDCPVVFHNVDTILYGRDFKRVARALQNADGYIDVFGSNNQEFSYVLADQAGNVREIAEKIVLSTLATSGLYGFANADMFERHYNQAEDNYISSVYKRMILFGKTIAVGEKYHESESVVLGTPAEYINASLTRFA